MKYFVLLAKLLFTTMLIYFAVKDIDFNVSFATLKSANGVLILALCTVIVILQSVFAGYRLKFLLSMFNCKIPASEGIRNLFLGNFFAQTMISFIGGDAMRVLSLKRSGISTDVAMRSILLDRILGSIGLQILFLMTMPALLHFINAESMKLTIWILAIVSSASIVVFCLMGLLPQDVFKNKLLNKLLDYSAVSRYLTEAKWLSNGIILLSCLLHFCNFLTIYICLHLLGFHTSLLTCWIIGAPIMLLALAPISVGGWGVREGSMIVGFGLVGVPAEIALTTSIFIGLSALIGALPGAKFFFSKDKFVYSESDVLAAE